MSDEWEITQRTAARWKKRDQMATLCEGFRFTAETLFRMMGMGPATSSIPAPKKEKDVATSETVRGAIPTSVMRRDMVGG